MQNKNQNL